MPRNDLLHDHHYFWLVVFGRLKPGVDPEQAQEEMTVLLKREVKNYPEEHRGHDSVTVYPLWRSPFGANHFLSMLLPMLMAIAGLVLLLACANVANLMLVRSVGRRREIAIRMSLGASRWRLVRQLLVESLMLAIGRRRGRAADHVLDRGNIHEIPADDGFSDLAEHPSGPRGAACDVGDFAAHRRDFRDFAGAAILERSPGGGLERGHGQRVGRTAEGAPRERVGGGANFTFAAAADLRGIVHSQLYERAANQSGIQFAQRADRFLRSVYRGIFGCERRGIRSAAGGETGSAAGRYSRWRYRTAYRWDSAAARRP